MRDNSRNMGSESPGYCRPFTRDSLAKIKERRAEKAFRKRELAARRAEAEGFGDNLENNDKDDEWLQPDPTLEQGMSLPVKMAAEFQPEMVNIPLEDIDPFYRSIPTFVIVTGKKVIFRFSATDSLWLISPFNPIRRVALAVLTHRLFSLLITATILTDLLLMVMPNSLLVELTEFAFIAIYMFELAVKVVARGFILNKFSYIRDAWNGLDFVVFMLAFGTMGANMRHFLALRTSRIIRALESINIVPELNTMICTIIESLRKLLYVMILILFILFAFAVLGMQMYMGVLTQICIRNFPDDGSEDEERAINWQIWNNNVTNWYSYPSPDVYGEVVYPLCGNSSGSGGCPENYVCLQGYGANPNNGYTSFDSFGWSFISILRLMRRDVWEGLYQQILRTAGPWHMLFFVLIIFFGSYSLLSLILAIVVSTYFEQQKKEEQGDMAVAKKEEKAKRVELKDVAAEAQHAAGNKLNRSPHQCSRESCETRAGEQRESDHVADVKPGCSVSSGRAGHPTEPATLCSSHQIHLGYAAVNTIEMTQVNKSAGQTIRQQSLVSEAEAKPHNMKNLLTKRKLITGCTDFFCVWECGFPWTWVKQSISFIVLDPFMELFITLALFANTMLLAMDHYGLEENITLMYMMKRGHQILTKIFLVECAMKVVAMSPKFYFQSGWNIFDFVIVVLSLIEKIFEDNNIPGITAFRNYRLLRVFRLAKFWPKFNMLISTTREAMCAVGSLLLVLNMVILVFAAIGTHLFAKQYFDKVYLFPGGELPRLNFTDFGHSFVLVFQVLCGQWIESMWNCMLVAGSTCIPFFLMMVVIGNLVVVNLFVALLLSRFGARNLNSTPDKEVNQLDEAFNRIGRFFGWVRAKIRHALCCKNNQLNREMNQAGAESSPLPPTQEGVSIHAVKGEENESPADCMPPEFYERLPSFNLDNTRFGCGWKNTRLMALHLIEHRFFRTAIVIVILLSSWTLTLENVHLQKNPVLMNTLRYMDRIFTVIYLLEMCITWMGLGFVKYFRSTWYRLDFVIVVVSLTNVVPDLAGAGSFQIFHTARMLRALRPLRLISRMQGLRSVVIRMLQAIPSIFNALHICLPFWLIFAIMGVQLFNGKFHKCIDPYDGTRPDYRIIRNKVECLMNNCTWENSVMNFDHVGKAFLSLFQVATLNGFWIINDAIDAREVDDQPHREVNFVMYNYFVIFIIIGSFFTLNLFVGVFTENFKEHSKKSSAPNELSLTESQKMYYASMKKIRNKKPRKAIPKPKWKPQAIMFEIVTDKKFDMVIMLLIGLSILTMTMGHYQMSQDWNNFLSTVNFIFVAIFTCECCLKIFCFRHHYFKDPWNLFDLVVILLSIAGMVTRDLMQKYYIISPLLLRVVRVAKISKVMPQVKGDGPKGIRTILLALTMSLSAIFNICLLLFLVMFIFSIFGMSLFLNVKLRGGLDDVYNFQTFGQSFVLLFQMSTSAGWNDILDGIINEDDCDLPDPEHDTVGDCGNTQAGITFVLTYLWISFVIIMNMYIAVILDRYWRATKEIEEGVTDDDYNMYYEIWAQFDPDGVQYIRYDQLSDFLDVLEPPLQIHKPNKYKIISMDIPICKGDMMYCVDILDALTKDFFARKGNAIEEAVEVIEVQVAPDLSGYEPMSSTFRKQREEYCARLIQNTWRKHKNVCSGAIGDHVDKIEEQDEDAHTNLINADEEGGPNVHV